MSIYKNRTILPSSFITVVIQGAIRPHTFACLSSIRKHLPQAQIILSTWQGSDVAGLDYDLLVLSDAPQAKVCNFANGTLNNTNRQLVSTKAGVAKASGKYVLKIRTDFVLNSADFLRWWNAFPARDENFALFSHRVIVSSVYSRLCSDATRQPMPFHPSDFFMFGLAEDVKKYYDSIPLATNEELGNWKFLFPDRKPYSPETHRYTPEQFLFFSYVKKFFPKTKFHDWTDFNEENIALSNGILFNNFIFLDYKQSGIYCKKFSRQLKHPDAICGIISFAKFQQEYKSRCDKNYRLKRDTATGQFFRRVKNHAARFFRPIISFAKWLLRPVAVLWEVCVFVFARIRNGEEA